jgi:hypothetical protein
MSKFEIELTRTHVTHEGEPYEVWAAEVVNAEAYQRVVGKTPGEAIHALEGEFDDHFGHEERGNWDPETSLEEVLNLNV